jgi:hypothetical protein
VAGYNRAVEPHERFIGVRFDIEPYLLPGFGGPKRSEYLTELLRLTAVSVQRAHEAGLLYGADIPFWYDAPSELTYQPVRVEFEGVEKPVSEHILDLVDDVSIMDYRTEAHGADGTIRHGLGELEYAEQVGKSVFIALETFPVPDEMLMDIGGEPRRGLPSESLERPLVVAAQVGDSVRVAYLPGWPGRSGLPEAFDSWVGELPEGSSSLFWWPVGLTIDVPAGKVSFAGQDPGRLRRVMEATALEFSGYRAFAGFAIHHALSYRDFLGR